MLTALMLATALGGGEAAAFHLTDTKGVVHTLAAYRGKWVLVNAWASWCAPCLVEMPELDGLARSHPDLIVLGMAVDGLDARRVTQFAERLRVRYPMIAADEAALRQFKLRAYPTSILYDRSGTAVLTKEGRITRQDVEAIIGVPAK